jgi:hypothetical protein
LDPRKLGFESVETISIVLALAARPAPISEKRVFGALAGFLTGRNGRNPVSENTRFKALGSMNDPWNRREWIEKSPGKFFHREPTRCNSFRP